MQSTMNEADTADVWERLSPLLEDAMSKLGERDRALLVLRFYQNKSGPEAAALMGIREGAAHMRVTRAIEKLRIFFAKRGVDSTAATIAETISTHSVQAAPVALAKSVTAVALAKGAAASGSTLTLIKGALKIMAWTRIKTAVAVGTVALLAAGTALQKYEIHREGHGLVTLHVVNAPLDEVIRKIEHQSGQAIAWDRRLHGPVTLTVNDMPLGQVLNQLILQTGAYWTVDYAVFDSKSALRKLETALQGEMELRDAGWTNLSCGPLGVEVTIRSVGRAPNGVFGTVVSGGRSGPPGAVLTRMTVVVPFQLSPPGDAANWRAISEAHSMPEGPDRMQAIEAANKTMSEARLKRGDPQEIIKQAVRNGTNDGVLAPERMLVDLQLVPRIDEAVPVAATPEKAEHLAQKAHASWATIYTLRQSPLAQFGITLVHRGEPDPNPPSSPSSRPLWVPTNATQIAQSVQQAAINSLTLTSDQRAFRNQELAKLKQNH